MAEAAPAAPPAGATVLPPGAVASTAAAAAAAAGVTVGATAAPEPTAGPTKTNLSRFVNAVPKLERKHSSGDLHSRLKTRKVLGVGTTDNGDVHRSKISQVLGHNEHLYVRFPRGLLGWYMLVTCGLGLQGGLLLVSPAWAAHLQVMAAQFSSTDGLAISSRCHGVTLIGLSNLLYAVCGTSDKGIIRTGLGVLALIDTVALATQALALAQSVGSSRWSWLQLGMHGVSAAVSLIYLCVSRNNHGLVGRKPAPLVAPPAAADADSRKKSL